VSIATGQPRGRVVLLHDTYGVHVIRRSAVVAMARKDTAIIIQFSCPDREITVDTFLWNAVNAIYASIVSEDSDVIWTRHPSGEWTRVPDVQEKR
jgi:NAD-dependent oxidoreductase involved in siderophore biosynthesis